MASLELQPHPLHSCSDDKHEEADEKVGRAHDKKRVDDLESGQFEGVATGVAASTTGEAANEKDIRRTLLGDDEDSHTRSDRLRAAAEAHLSTGIDSSLDRTAGVLADTECFSAEALGHLQLQRESFRAQRRNLVAADEHAARSGALLRALRRRLASDRHLQLLVILAETLAIAIIIYVKYYK